MDPDSERGLVTIIGRGNSGTRILSKALFASGVFMGRQLNNSADTVPAASMYSACKIIARHVRWEGDLRWDFDRLHTMPVDSEFADLVHDYLEHILASRFARRGWKLPETTLAYPWIVRMLPAIKYVYMVRDPRDGLLGGHLTDDLRRADVECPELDSTYEQRVASWKYQYEIVKSTPQPRHFISVRFEDLVLDQEATMQRLEAFLEMPLARVVVDKTRVGRWKADTRVLRYIEPIEEHMREHRYI